MNHQSVDKFSIYYSTLTQLFEKIYKNISKKNPNYAEIVKFYKELPELLKNDKSNNKELNADKYFIYMKKALDVDHLKIIEAFLENMQVLMKNDLLKGKSDSLKLSTDQNSPTSRYPLYKKCLIDNIIDCIIKIFSGGNDENIWMNTVKLFYIMFKNPNIEIHSDSLLKIFKNCIRIYLTSRTNINIEITKSCFNCMITSVFNKMEALNAGFLDRDLNINYLNLLKSNNLETMGDEYKSNRSIMNSEMGLSNNYFKYLTQKSPLEDLISKIVRNSVDMVCIYDAKAENYKEDGKNHKLKKGLSDTTLPSVKDIIPITTAISIEDNFVTEKKGKTSTTLPMLIYNEKGEPSGVFGWCFNCRKQAEYYCKETRLPLCSSDCKRKVLILDEKINKFFAGDDTDTELANLYFHDSVNIFKSLCKLINTSFSNTNEAFNSKSKLLSLELILIIFERPGPYFLSTPEFVKIVKEELMEGLLKNCVTEDINLFGQSITVFNKLWLHFREFLKQQISVFIEKVFLKILDSGNYSMQHKWFVMEYFHKMTSSAKFYIELHVNYDSDLNEKDILNRFVGVLGRIAQGKNLKLENSSLPQQENNLRFRSIEVVTMMIRNLLSFMIEQGGVNFQNKFLGEQNYGSNKDNMHDETYFDNPEEQSIMDQTVVDMKEKLEQNRKLKYDINKAVEKFNIKPKNGVNYLRKVGIINSENEVSEITNFIKTAQNLKKNMIGDYLGDNNELCLKVLDYYTDTFNFENMHIVEAIRLFLSYYQIPGEGQKIDRIMQKFAEKYYKDNSNSFFTADCAYYLSFATIMLQTDTHNPNVKNKMGLQGFANMLKGVNGPKDLEISYLEDIYNQILKKPLTLIEHEEAKDKMDTSKTKQDLFKRETERMYLEGTQSLKQGHDKQYLVINNETDQVGPLMGSIWTNILAMYSILMEENDDMSIIRLCAEGFEGAIKICGLTNLDIQKEALFKGYSKLTNLLNGKEIRDRHMLCIKGILTLARDDGQFLKGIWKVILDIISKIDYYHMFVSCSKTELENFSNDIRAKKKGSSSAEKEISIEKGNIDRIAKEISQEDYEIVFNKTEYLDQESIIDFVKSLCEVSHAELSNSENPRIFSLQKLVEVAEFNMGRIQMVWSKIWHIISDYLTLVGSNSNPNIAEKAVDSLRQLAKKFLQKDEMSIYQFQKEFLKPFQDIFVNNINVYRTKEYVITCIANLVLLDAASIKSGWRIIFNIFLLAADDSSVEIIRRTFETLDKVFKNHYHIVKDNFPELAHCLKKFAKHYPGECIRLFIECSEKLEDQNQIYAVISSLGSITTNPNEEIRKTSYKAFFGLISHFHKGFNSEVWRQIFKVTIQPIIEDLKAFKYESTLYEFLREICDLFFNYYSKMEFLLSNFFSIIVNLTTSDNESIALIGIDTINYFIEKLIPKMTEKNWQALFEMISKLFKMTQQTDLIELSNDQINNIQLHMETQALVNKNIVYCIVQHNLIEVCNNIIDKYYNKLNPENIILILDCLKESIFFAYEFNSMFELRKLISNNFMSELKHVMALYKQHKDGISCYFKILNKIIETNSNKFSDKDKLGYVDELINISLKLLKQFVERINYKEGDEFVQQENERLINNMVPTVITNIIPTLINVKFVDKTKNIEEFIKIFLELIMCNIIEVRVYVKNILGLILDKSINYLVSLNKTDDNI